MCTVRTFGFQRQAFPFRFGHTAVWLALGILMRMWRAVPAAEDKHRVLYIMRHTVVLPLFWDKELEEWSCGESIWTCKRVLVRSTETLCPLGEAL